MDLSDLGFKERQNYSSGGTFVVAAQRKFEHGSSEVFYESLSTAISEIASENAFGSTTNIIDKAKSIPFAKLFANANIAMIDNNRDLFIKSSSLSR